MYCEFICSTIGQWVCNTCGKSSNTYINFKKPVRQCSGIQTKQLTQIDHSSCKYRSQESIRKEICPSCSGNISIKIFSCTLHKECCLSNKLPLIKNCNTCEDYELPNTT